jgi:hypothetical protein
MNARASGTDRAVGRTDPLDGLRYYPAFILLVVVLFLVSKALSSSFILRGFIDQVIVPRFHTLSLRPGTWSMWAAAGATGPCSSGTPTGR